MIINTINTINTNAYTQAHYQRKVSSYLQILAKPSYILSLDVPYIVIREFSNILLKISLSSSSSTSASAVLELETFLNKSSYKKILKSGLEGLVNKPTTTTTTNTNTTTTTSTSTNTINADVTILLYSQVDDKFDTISITAMSLSKFIL